jgi:hypothetical protein
VQQRFFRPPKQRNVTEVVARTAWQQRNEQYLGQRAVLVLPRIVNGEKHSAKRSKRSPIDQETL